MELELDPDEAQLLHTYLGREVDRLNAELSRSEQRDFRHALAADVERLGEIHARLGKLLRSELLDEEAVPEA